MANRLNPLNIKDFSGGLNLIDDSFLLADNEVPSCLNVDLSIRGGFASRKGWTRWNSTDIEADVEDWNPRAMHSQVFGSTDQVMIANQAVYTGGGIGKGTVLAGSTGSFSPVLVGADPMVCNAQPHIADFIPWGDRVYVACGKTQQVAEWTGTGAATLLTASAAANWTNDYTAPSGACAPMSEVGCTHGGYMFVANTSEDGTDYPNRVRWSHPNNPENWAALDYIDLQDGGPGITGLVSFGDHLVVFKTDSVWRIDGYDAASWQASKVSAKLGAINAQCIAQAEDSIFFLSWPHGIFQYSSEGVYDVSEKVRPGIDSVGFNEDVIDESWLHYSNGRLWVNIPFHSDTVPTDAATSLILDRRVNENGSWVAYRAADGTTVGPMVETLGSDKLYGAMRGAASVVEIGANDDPIDNLAGEPANFEAYLTSRWFDAGWPNLKKSWKRPEIVLKNSDVEQTFRVEVYRDLNESTAVKSFDKVVPLRSTAFVWGDFDWGDGSVWGAASSGARIEDLPSFGNAESIRIRVQGPAGFAWGVDAFLFKHLDRRFK